MEKIKKIANKLLTREVILYVVFGVGTTVVNLGSFYIMNSLFGWNENISNLIAIILAVVFAYVTNKDLVFHSQARDIKEKINEFFRFILGRAFTMIIEFVGGWILFKTPMPEIISKLIVTVVVVILNFFISKFFAFKSEKFDAIEGGTKK